MRPPYSLFQVETCFVPLKPRQIGAEMKDENWQGHEKKEFFGLSANLEGAPKVFSGPNIEPPVES